MVISYLTGHRHLEELMISLTEAAQRLDLLKSKMPSSRESRN